jgi:hypothetical protein
VVGRDPDPGHGDRRQGEPTTPLRATPEPAVSALSGSSHGIAQRSVSAPNSGCTTDDSRDAARTMPDAAAYE